MKAILYREKGKKQWRKGWVDRSDGKMKIHPYNGNSPRPLIYGREDIDVESQ